MHLTLRDALGMPATYSETFDRKADGWHLRCGEMVQPDGSEPDFSATPFAGQVKQNAFNNTICILAQQGEDGFERVEYDIGSLDSPMLGWASELDLPPALMAGP